MWKTLIVSSLLLCFAFVKGNLFADGGYQTNVTPCINQWRYKEKLENGANIETELTGCVNIEDFPPFPYFVEDTEEISALLLPRDSRTDTLRWCPVIRDVYNPTPIKTESNRHNWGYCLDATITIVPTSSPQSKTFSPTLLPTGNPTITTLSPTVLSRENVTNAPTAHTSEATFLPSSAVTQIATLRPTIESTNEPSDLRTESPFLQVPLGDSVRNKSILTWPFLAIVIIVALLGASIFVWKRRRTSKLKEEGLGINSNLAKA